MGIEVVVLTQEEKTLLSKIHFFDKNEHTFFDDKGLSANYAAALANMLLDRKAIPEIRRKYFRDPDYVEKGKRSHYQIFQDNGCKGENILRHPHFLAYLKYFIFGPDLPKPVIDRYCSEIESEPFPTSGDYPVYIDLARSLTKEFDLDTKYVCDEFYKLSLECDLSPDIARMVRSNVLRLGYRK